MSQLRRASGSIGATEKGHSEGDYHWLDGTALPLGDTSWARGEPNNYGSNGGEDCLTAGPGGWNDDSCEKSKPFVCQPLYDELRPHVLSQHELSRLCEVVLILRSEVIPELVGGGPPSAPLVTLITRLLQDAQARLSLSRTQMALEGT